MTTKFEQYPIGKTFFAPSMPDNTPVLVTVVGYWNNAMARDLGVIVQDESGAEWNISRYYLDEDGEGVYGDDYTDTQIEKGLSAAS